MTCEDCINWIEELPFGDQGRFPAYCQNVRDPDEWDADKCELFEERLR